MFHFKNLTLLLLVMLCATACKKDPRIEPASVAPAPTYTGPKWTSYTKANGALPNNQVNAIAIDQNDTKWIGTANGLVRIDDTRISLFDENNSGLPSSEILAVASDAAGNVWLGTRHGLSVYNGTSWHTYTTANSVLKSNVVKCLAYDKRHQVLWAGTDQGIVKISGNNTWEFIEEEFVILSMATDHTGALWLGVFDAQAFRGLIEKHEQGVSQYYRLDKEGYASAFPYALAVDGNNRIVATLGGTVVKTVIHFESGQWNELGCPQNLYALRAIAIADQQIWLGGKGLCLLNGPSSPVTNIPGKESSVLSMAIDHKGRKWLGTFDEGLAVYHENGYE